MKYIGGIYDLIMTMVIFIIMLPFYLIGAFTGYILLALKAGYNYATKLG